MGGVERCEAGTEEGIAASPGKLATTSGTGAP